MAVLRGDGPVKLGNALGRLTRLALVSGALTSGCYNYRVAAPQVSNLNETVSVTKWSYVWGALQSKDEDTSCICLNNGLKEVTASTNYGYLLLGVATLGLVVPTQLSYQCGKPPVGGKWPDPPQGCANLQPLPAVPPQDTSTQGTSTQGTSTQDTSTQGTSTQGTDPAAPSPAGTGAGTSAPADSGSAPAGTAPTPIVPNDPDAGDF